MILELIIVLSEMGLVEEALCVYIRLKDLPAVRACNALLHGFGNAGWLDSMLEFYRQMGSRGLSPDVVTYGILINGCCRKGDLSKALELFNEMSERGVNAN